MTDLSPEDAATLEEAVDRLAALYPLGDTDEQIAGFWKAVRLLVERKAAGRNAPLSPFAVTDEQVEKMNALLRAAKRAGGH